MGVIGGTGHLGYGLAVRWAAAGLEVAVGSRSIEKAAGAARTAAQDYGVTMLGVTNAEAARFADVLVISVPYDGREELLREVLGNLHDGSTVLDVCVPFRRKGSACAGPAPSDPCGRAAMSAAEETQALAAERVTVVSGLHTISSHLLLPPDRPISVDALVCGDSDLSKSLVVELCARIGIRAFDVGGISASRVAEGLTPILIRLNKRYKVHDIGIRFTV